MKERLLAYAKYAPLVGYPLFYLLCLSVFAALTFPYDKLRQRVVATFNAEQRASSGQQELEIDEMGGYWITGVRVRGARLLTNAANEATSTAVDYGSAGSGGAGSSRKDTTKPPSKIEIDEATVRYSILSALIGNTSISFDVYAFGGEVSGSYEVRGKDKAVDVTLDSLDLGAIEPLTALLGIPVKGKLGGTAKVSLPEGKVSKGTGTVAFEAEEVSVGDGKAKLKDALALPKVEVGALTFTGEVKEGTLRISKLSAGGKDVELQGDGRITLHENFGESLCDVQARFKINDAYRTKSDVTKSLFGAPGSNAPALFELADPKIKQSKRADGFYGWTLRGQLSRLEFIPAGGPAGAAGAATPNFGIPGIKAGP